MEMFHEELTQTDYKFLSRTSQGESNHVTDEEEGLNWPKEITEDDRKEVIKRLRKALSRWATEAHGETVGEDYIVINKEEVDGGTLTSTISIHSLALMFAELILRLQPLFPSVEEYRDYFLLDLEDLARYSEERGYGLEDHIRKPNSFFSFLVKDPG